jgi:heme/copper-type cytochrome/quinol oxidase subunit 3
MSGLKKHRFHLVDKSPWPLFISVVAFGLTVSLVGMFHGYVNSGFLFTLSLVSIIILMGIWWRDVIREATFLGNHTTKVQRSIRIGVVLFIVSEIMFFVSFFWGYFHSSLSPSIVLGDCWPPLGLAVFSPWDIPLLNTGILLLSGATVTWAHHALRAAEDKEAVVALICTVSLGLIFTALQFYEYLVAPFQIDSGIYGSTFFVTTGFHGLHVIIGTLFLIVCCIRAYYKHFTNSRHIGFEAAAWYWHFVDVVWLFLFFSVYIWGGMEATMDIDFTDFDNALTIGKTVSSQVSPLVDKF